MKIKKDERFKWKLIRRRKEGYWFDLYCNDTLVMRSYHNKLESVPYLYKHMICRYWYRDKMWKSLKMELPNRK